MKYSQLFGKTTRNVPKDEVAVNAQLLTKAGFIYKVMAGVYAYTPLGLKVLDNRNECHWRSGNDYDRPSAPSNLGRDWSLG